MWPINNRLLSRCDVCNAWPNKTTRWWMTRGVRYEIERWFDKTCWSSSLDRINRVAFSVLVNCRHGTCQTYLIIWLMSSHMWYNRVKQQWFILWSMLVMYQFHHSIVVINTMNTINTINTIDQTCRCIQCSSSIESIQSIKHLMSFTIEWIQSMQSIYCITSATHASIQSHQPSHLMYCSHGTYEVNELIVWYG